MSGSRRTWPSRDHRRRAVPRRGVLANPDVTTSSLRNTWSISNSMGLPVTPTCTYRPPLRVARSADADAGGGAGAVDRAVVAGAGRAGLRVGGVDRPDAHRAGELQAGRIARGARQHHVGALGGQHLAGQDAHRAGARRPAPNRRARRRPGRTGSWPRTRAARTGCPPAPRRCSWTSWRFRAGISTYFAKPPLTWLPIERRVGHRLRRPSRQRGAQVAGVEVGLGRDALAQPRLVHARAQLAHVAGDLVAHDHGRVARELVRDDVQVGAADAHGGHLDHHLARPGDRHRHRVETHVLRAAVPACADRSSSPDPTRLRCLLLPGGAARLVRCTGACIMPAVTPGSGEHPRRAVAPGPSGPERRDRPARDRHAARRRRRSCRAGSSPVRIARHGRSALGHRRAADAPPDVRPARGPRTALGISSGGWITDRSAPAERRPWSTQRGACPPIDRPGPPASGTVGVRHRSGDASSGMAAPLRPAMPTACGPSVRRRRSRRPVEREGRAGPTKRKRPAVAGGACLGGRRREESIYLKVYVFGAAPAWSRTPCRTTG